MNRKLIIYLLLVFSLFACNKETEKTIFDVQTLNFDYKNSFVLDYKDAFHNGFQVPSKFQTPSDKLILKYQVNNTFVGAEHLYYKLYYQNESYKFDEVEGLLNDYNPLCEENFYGSYPDTKIGFKKISDIQNKDVLTITDSIQIVGNPRNEKKYFNFETHRLGTDVMSDSIINQKIEQIKSNPEWFNTVKAVAASNKTSVEKQLRADAIWVLKDQGLINNRWQRNLRTGRYSALIVVLTEEQLNALPDYIKDISKQSNGKYVNPYYYFLYGEGKKLGQSLVIDNFVNVKAHVPLDKGIFVKLQNNEDTLHFNNVVNNHNTTYTQAALEYYRNVRTKDEIVNNVNRLSSDFYDNYTVEDYKSDSVKYLNDIHPVYFTNSSSPGKTFGYDSEKKRVWFKNPASSVNDKHKENVGIKTRHGFTYGKYTYKINMAELLNKHQVWTGLTNAIWMVADAHPANQRRWVEDKSKGYMPYYGAGEGVDRVNQISYTEVDFEIVKAPQYWPKHYYHYFSDGGIKTEPESNKDKVMVTCTNFDMACKAPEDFKSGIQYIKYQDKKIEFNRWTEWHNALTSKTPALDDELFAQDYYYFQLEWKPTEIIWRIGPEKDDLRVVGYMNDKITSIPNNQMICIITQEYHHTKWWPESPFTQENTPFIGHDLEGYLYSIEIE